MRIVRRFFVFILISATLTSSGQYSKEFKRLFHDASYLLESGFYEEAYNRYKNLLILDPGNCNILFHCGVCCLNIQGLELEALAHLKKAVKCATPDYRNNAPDESRSPILTYFMLGKAYHLNYEFDQAVENYNKRQAIHLLISIYQESRWITKPLLSLGSNHVDFGGIILPESAIAISCSMDTG